MKPEWELLASSSTENISFANINCQDQQSLCNEQDINGYPTLKFYQDGKLKATYSEAFKSNNMKYFVDKMMDAPVQMKTVDQAQPLVHSQSIKSTFILIAPQLDPVFSNVAITEYSSSSKFVFVNTSAISLPQDKESLIHLLHTLGLTQNDIPSSDLDLQNLAYITATSHSGKCAVRYPIRVGSSGHTLSSLSHWVRLAKYECTPEITAAINSDLKQEGSRTVFAVLNNTNSPASAQFIEEFRQLAVKLTGHSPLVDNEEEADSPYFFTYVNSQELPYFTTHFHVTVGSYPLVFIHDFATQFVLNYSL